MFLIKIIINLCKVLGYFFGFDSLNSPIKLEAEIFSVKSDNVSNFSSEENSTLSNHQSKRNSLGVLLFTLVIVTFVIYSSQTDSLSDIFLNITEKSVEIPSSSFNSNSVILRSLGYYKSWFNPQNFGRQQAQEKLNFERFLWFAEANVDDLMDRGRPFPGGREPIIPIWNDGLIHDAI